MTEVPSRTCADLLHCNAASYEARKDPGESVLLNQQEEKVLCATIGIVKSYPAGR
jgi:hypothetical protein